MNNPSSQPAPEPSTPGSGELANAIEKAINSLQKVRDELDEQGDDRSYVGLLRAALEGSGVLEESEWEALEEAEEALFDGVEDVTSAAPEDELGFDDPEDGIEQVPDTIDYEDLVITARQEASEAGKYAGPDEIAIIQEEFVELEATDLEIENSAYAIHWARLENGESPFTDLDEAWNDPNFRALVARDIEEQRLDSPVFEQPGEAPGYDMGRGPDAPGYDMEGQPDSLDELLESLEISLEDIKLLVATYDHEHSLLIAYMGDGVLIRDTNWAEDNRAILTKLPEEYLDMTPTDLIEEVLRPIAEKDHPTSEMPMGQGGHGYDMDPGFSMGVEETPYHGKTVAEILGISTETETTEVLRGFDGAPEKPAAPREIPMLIQNYDEMFSFIQDVYENPALAQEFLDRFFPEPELDLTDSSYTRAMQYHDNFKTFILAINDFGRLNGISTKQIFDIFSEFSPDPDGVSLDWRTDVRYRNLLWRDGADELTNEYTLDSYPKQMIVTLFPSLSIHYVCREEGDKLIIEARVVEPHNLQDTMLAMVEEDIQDKIIIPRASGERFAIKRIQLQLDKVISHF